MRVHGTLIHAPLPGELEIIEDACVSVGNDGAIIDVERGAGDKCQTVGHREDAIMLGRGQYLLPGLVDCHVHAPQWPQLGKSLDLPLNEWLQRHTFPLEARYADLEFAQRSYESLVGSLLANGTTTAAYFGTIHVEATKLLADIARDRGQRAVIGKVAMDHPSQCPEFYRDATTESGLDGTMAFIEYVDNMGCDLLRPAVTPRFIPACTDRMLEGLGKIADQYGCHIQTHCSESDWEHQHVIDRLGTTDTQSLDRFGLLTDKTVLAHAVFADDRDLGTIVRRQSGIAHCPLSNLYLAHAVFPARRALDRGVKLGLGTDVAGGASPSVLDNCRMAVTVSRALQDGVDPALPANRRGRQDSVIDFREAFWMATAGGAETLGLKTGRFASDYAFDAMVVDTAIEDSDVDAWDDMDTTDQVLQKIVYNARRQDISMVWVQGRPVSGREFRD
jgi:guanine deaminase